VRSEAAVVIFLQKASAAKRVYATVVNARTNTDGNKEQGITFPSGYMQKKLIKEVYSEVGINPADVAYVEAHGTGTKVNLASIILVTVLQLIVDMIGTAQTTWLEPKYVLEHAFHILLSD
jgi:3-oxoacyl-(acyl-carrier-protein) synthase